jgi:hypothetical protein
MRVRSAGAVLLAVVGLVACGEESADESAGAAAGEAVARNAEDGAASPADEAGSEPSGSSGESEGSGGSDGPPAASPSSECPADDAPPAVPDESPPPTMAGDMEPGEIPNDVMSGEMVPQFGELIVDVPTGGCIDIPTSLREGQRVLIYSHADDDKYTHIEIFAPNGQVVGDWHTGQPGTSEGWDFFNENFVPADGVFVFRVTHERGSDDPFVISFYGQP